MSSVHLFASSHYSHRFLSRPLMSTPFILHPQYASDEFRMLALRIMCILMYIASSSNLWEGASLRNRGALQCGSRFNDRPGRRSRPLAWRQAARTPDEKLFVRVQWPKTRRRKAEPTCLGGPSLPPPLHPPRPLLNMLVQR